MTQKKEHATCHLNVGDVVEIQTLLGTIED